MTTSTLTSSAWQRTTASQHALRTLTDAIASDPAAIGDAVATALGSFDSLDDLLLQAHAIWARTVDARIDLLLENGADDGRAAFDRLWADTARLLRGTALLLAHHAQHPAVVRAHAQHVRRIQLLLGVTLPDGWAVEQRTHRRARSPRPCLRLPRLRVA